MVIPRMTSLAFAESTMPANHAAMTAVANNNVRKENEGFIYAQCQAEDYGMPCIRTTSWKVLLGIVIGEIE